MFVLTCYFSEDTTTMSYCSLQPVKMRILEPGKQHMSDRAKSEPREFLVELVGEILKGNSSARPVSVDGPLVEIGLSSVDMVRLMLAVEAEFEIEIPPSDISPETFRSISTIEALVSRMIPRTEPS